MCWLKETTRNKKYTFTAEKQKVYRPAGRWRKEQNTLHLNHWHCKPWRWSLWHQRRALKQRTHRCHTQVSHTTPGSVRHCHAQYSVWKNKTDYDLKMDKLVLRGFFAPYTSLLTQLLCPFDGGACVGCISFCQVHHLWADLPPHKRIQTCKERSEVMISLNGWMWMYP